jgi:hypothetical protein
MSTPRACSFLSAAGRSVVRLENSKHGFRVRPPARLLILVGREAAVSEVRNSIRRGRFVTVLGPVGIGTATVAVAAGRDADSRLIAALVHALKARR